MLKKGLLLLTSLLLFSACTKFFSTDQQAVPQTVQEVEVDDETDTSAQTGTVIEMNMKGFEYSQDEIRVKAGETVTLKVTNTGGTHDIVIDELNARSSVVQTGEVAEVTFTVPESAAGKEYEYYCSVGNHRQLGMFGTLIIE